MISSFKVRLSRCCGGIGCPLVPGEALGILGRRIPWARETVTGTGKKLELGLSFSYVGPERGFPGSSELGEPNGGGQGETPSRAPVRAKEGYVRRGQAHPNPQEEGDGNLLRETTDNLDSCSMHEPAQFCFLRKHHCWLKWSLPSQPL